MFNISEHLTVVSENPYTALRRVHVSRELTELAEEYLATLGTSLSETARKYRLHKRGTSGYSCGVGYATFDADFIGGNGNGRAERAFREWLDNNA